MPYETEKDNCVILNSYQEYTKVLLFNLFILLFLLVFSLADSILIVYHLKSYDRKPLIRQSILSSYIISRYGLACRGTVFVFFKDTSQSISRHCSYHRFFVFL